MKKLLTIISLAMILINVSGCQLAISDSQTDQNSKDRLVGFFIINRAETEDSSDLDISEKIYGEEIKEWLDSDSGRVEEIVNYNFNNLEGVLYTTNILVTKDEEMFNTTVVGTEVSNQNTDVSITDEGTKYTSKGVLTIWLEEVVLLRIIPVYQQVDNKIYLNMSQAYLSWVDFGLGEGQRYAYKHEESTETIVNGKKKNISTDITIEYEFRIQPQKTVVLQMNNEDIVIKRDEYLPDDVPEVLEFNESTEYIVVETYKVVDGVNVVSRKIYEKSNQDLTTQYAKENGYLINRVTLLSWK